MEFFSIRELTRSAKAENLGIDNTPSAEVETRLTALVENILDPLRRAWGAPIRVNSGYRCPTLNKAVGGAAKSQHLTGEAADITVGSPVKNRRLFELAIKMDLPFDQIIDEYGFSWIHISFTGAFSRHKILHIGK